MSARPLSLTLCTMYVMGLFRKGDISTHVFPSKTRPESAPGLGLGQVLKTQPSSRFQINIRWYKVRNLIHSQRRVIDLLQRPCSCCCSPHYQYSDTLQTIGPNLILIQHAFITISLHGQRHKINYPTSRDYKLSFDSGSYYQKNSNFTSGENIPEMSITALT